MFRAWRFFQCMLLFVASLSFSLDLRAHDETARDAAGLAEAYRGQTESLRCGDVLFRIERFSDQGIGSDDVLVATESSVTCRWAFDHNEGRYFYFQSRNHTVIGNPDAGSGDERVVNSLQGFCFNEHGAAGWKNPQSPGPVANDLPRLMRGFEVPLLNLLGFAPFGSQAPQGMDYEQVAQAFTMIGSAKSSKPAGSGEQLLTFGRTLSQNLSFESVWRFDLKNNVPLMVHAYTVQDNVDGATRRGLNYREVFKWEERDGVVVPISISVDRPVVRTSRGDQNSMRMSTRYTDVKLHWFKVNTPPDIHFFDHNIMQKPEELLRAVDPIASGAETLLDKTSGAPSASADP